MCASWAQISKRGGRKGRYNDIRLFFSAEGRKRNVKSLSSHISEQMGPRWGGEEGKKNDISLLNYLQASGREKLLRAAAAEGVPADVIFKHSLIYV